MMHMVPSDSLSQAVRAAKDGRRQEARDLFLRVAAEEPNHPVAWIWLSDLLEDPDERIKALEKALALSPGHPALQVRLEALRKQASMASSSAQVSPTRSSQAMMEQSAAGNFSSVFTSDPLAVSSEEAAAPPEQRAAPPERRASAQARQWFREAKERVKAGKRQEALEVLQRIVEVEPDHPSVWMLIAELQPDLPEKITALEKALALRPNDLEIQKNLNQLKKVQGDPWLRAQQMEEVGDFNLAIYTYMNIAAHSQQAAERLEAQRRIAALKLRQDSDRIKPVDPTLNVLRLAAGPVLLFFVMTFIQSGLKPLNLGLSSLMSLAGVSIGCLLLTVTGLRPLHPVWVKTFGHPGSHSEADARILLRVFGWLLAVVPFLLFFAGAAVRLISLWTAVVNGQP